MTSRIILSRDGAVLHIQLNRPEKKNALDREMYLAMIAALEAAQSDQATRVVVFSSSSAAFTAGNDLNDFRHSLGMPGEFPAFTFVKTLAGFNKPMIAAVDGDALGVGTTMLFHCDLVYATSGARFKMPFVDLGLVPEAASSLLAPQRLGFAKASQYLLLCDEFDGDEALHMGVVNALTTPAELLEMAMKAAHRLAEKPVEALMAARRLIRGDQKDVLARMDAEGALFKQALASPQLRARLEAFFATRGG